jgi:hypothetical protein
MRRRFPFPFVLCVLALTSVMSVPVWGQDSETEALRKEVEELKQRVQELEKQQAAKPEANRAATSPDESSAGAARAPLPQAAPPSQPEADQTAGSPTTAGAAGSLAPQMSPPVEPEASPAVTSPDQSSGPAVGQPAPQPLTPPVQRAAEPQATPSPPNPVTVLREKWRRVARNMSQAEIADVLGQPSKEIHIDSKLVWYYYYPGIGGASVFFKSNGHVSAYQGPTVGWW